MDVFWFTIFIFLSAVIKPYIGYKDLSLFLSPLSLLAFNVFVTANTDTANILES